MRNTFLLLTVLIFLLSLSCVTKQKGSSKSSSGTPTWSQAVYCDIESAQVCAVAQSAEDCTKLGGKKVNACTVYGNTSE